MLGNIGPLELVLILVLAMIIFGPAKLPEMGRSLGRAIREFRRASREIVNEVDRVAREGDETARRETAGLVSRYRALTPEQRARVLAELPRTEAEIVARLGDGQEPVDEVAGEYDADIASLNEILSRAIRRAGNSSPRA